MPFHLHKAIRYAYGILFFLGLGLASSCDSGSRDATDRPSAEPTSPPIAVGELKLQSRACYFADADSIEKQTQIKIDTASCREIEQIASIMDYVGLPQNFKIYRGNISNALATMVNKQRVIIYNKDLFTDLDEMSSGYWTSLFIIAHEIGHHLANNISDSSDALKAELDADRFAGFLLYRMGADSNQAIGAVASRFISTQTDTKTHPSKRKRIETVIQSWKESNDLRLMSAVPPPVYDRFTKAIGSENEKFQAGYSYEYLMFNDWFLKKWGLANRIDYYDQDYGSLDTSYYSKLPLPCRQKKFKGIITDIQKRAGYPEFKNVKLLEVKILVTQVDPEFPVAGIALNDHVNVTVAYQPLFGYDQIKTFYDFFVGGRRIAFSVYPYQDELGETTNYLSNVYATNE